MTICSHVFNRADFDARCIHWHDNFADSFVGRTFITGSANQIAIVSMFTEACPDFLAIDHEFITVALGKSLERGQVAT